MTHSKKSIAKTILCIMIILSLMSGMAVDTTAASGYELLVDKDRFMSDKLILNGCSHAVSDRGVQIIFVDGSAKVEFPVSDRSVTNDSNTLRLVLLNTWASLNATLTCEYIDDLDIKRTAKFELKVAKSNEPSEYLLSAPFAENITSASIFFNGSSSAAVTIVSFSAISYFYNTDQYAGKLDNHSLTKDGNMANISGTVSYDTVLAYPSANLALYKLKIGDNVDDVVINEFVASQPMSLAFNFNIDVPGISDKLSKYFVAVLTKDNEIIPITQCVFLSGENNEKDHDKGQIAFKGSETEFYAWSNEAGCSTVIVDVYLDQAESLNQSGYRYVLDQGEYYFSQSYIDQITKKINNYTDFGCDVYLRLLIQGKGRARDDVKYVSIDSRSLDTAAKLFAVTDLILSNNSGEGIRGFVLGSALDLAGKYNYAGYINMAEYSELITADCAVLSQVMQKNGLELEIVLPISDHSFGKMTVAKTHDEYTSYRSDLLLKSIYSCSSLYGLDLSKYYVMLESFNSPVASEENGGYYVVENDDIISANDCGALSDLMDDLCYEFGVDNRQFLFNFRPSADIDAENFKVAYTYNYNILASTDDVRSYIISFLDSADEKSMTNALRTQFNYVDTEKNAEVSADALALLGVESWKELYDKYDKNDCVRTKLRSEPLSKKSDGRVEGSYPIWDFEDSGSTEEWAEFIGCQSLSVYSVAQGRSRSLVAQMSKDSSAAAGALYESIIYHSENAIVFENIDSLSFDVFIPLKNNDRVKYEIELTLIEDGKRSEYKGEILSGETVTFYADISDAQNVKQIILGSRCLDEENNGAYFVCINGITMNSNSLSDEELERIVLSGKLGTMIDENISYFFDEVILVALIISISAVATIIVWGVHAIKRKKYNKKLKKY